MLDFLSQFVSLLHVLALFHILQATNAQRLHIATLSRIGQTHHEASQTGYAAIGCTLLGIGTSHDVLELLVLHVAVA